ncbi:MAG: formate dehydrogenase accessory sulfurtransferase FdhD [Rhodopila sp.]
MATEGPNVAVTAGEGPGVATMAGKASGATVMAGEAPGIAVMAGGGPGVAVMAGGGPPSTPLPATAQSSPGQAPQSVDGGPPPAVTAGPVTTPAVVSTKANHAAPAPSTPAPRVAWRGDMPTTGARTVPTETPIALTYARATHAVMLATPADLEDFAIGFSLAEGIIRIPADILALDIVPLADGIECRMDLGGDRLDALTRRQRRMAGPSGCGLCGMDSIAAAIRPAPPVPQGRRFTPTHIRDAMQTMQAAQTLNAATRAVHAAAFWTPEHGLVAVREDVGRHNALDKLTGALARADIGVADGLLLLSSRVSVEMVQKAATAGAPVLVAISAPTSLAIRTAADAGITLIGIARPDGCEVFTCPDRIEIQADHHGG